MTFLNTIFDIIFPIYCISCKEKGFDLCINCLLSSPPAERESADWIFPLFDYRHPPIKKAIWLLKYKGKKRLSSVFAEALYSPILEELADLYQFENFREPILIPIPLAPKRYRERGYNQATLICSALVKLDKNKPARNTFGIANAGENFVLEKNILIKPKDTEHQARIEDRSKRLKNIIGSFKIKNPEIIKNRNIILIDDVTTTGATLSEARKTLKEVGAKKVIAFAVAH